MSRQSTKNLAGNVANDSIFSQVMSKKGFMWDFDGCFADTERIHFLAYSEAFAQFSHQVDEKEYYERFTFYGFGAKAEIDAYNLKCTPEQIANLKVEKYWQRIRDNTVQLFSEMRDVLKFLKARGAKIAIASNSPREEIELILKKHPEVFAQVDLIVGKTPELRKKPAPDIFNHTLKLLGLAPEEALVFEDSDRGLAAAAAAECEAIWLRTPFNRDFSTTQPHIASLSHSEFLKILSVSQRAGDVRVDG